MSEPLVACRAGACDADQVERILRIAKFHPVTDLLDWIAAHRGVKLVIATVHVPVAAAGRLA